ncbi:MAG: branched-chain amino acid ABC transporter permease [Spirochaetales bacterium]|nr:branched-chain amino acid ABC transporter permease [Spirochaetales bacterium]
MFSDYTQGIMIIACINMIAVLGISVLTGFTRLFSFGNAGFMSIGAYTSALLTAKMGMPFIPAILVGILFAGIAAYLLGSLTLKLKGDYFLITTLGFGEMVRVLFNYIPITGGARGLSGIPKYTTLPIAVICLVLAVIIAWTLIHSKYGRNFTAIREQEIAAESVGIDITRSKKMAFVFSAMFAGWAGALYAHNLMFLSPMMFNLAKSAELTITVVIGGLGSLTGSIFGSLVVTLLPEIFRSLANYRMFLYGLAVVLIIILRPAGLFGYREFSIRKSIAFVKAAPGTITALLKGKSSKDKMEARK